MDLASFAATIVLVTASGALAPGPLFFATISHGAKDGAKTGLTFSFAHTIVEFSLVMLFALGLVTVAQEPLVRLVVGVIGGLVLLVFGGFQIFRSISPGKEKAEEKRGTRSLVLLGLVFTGLNPFFIVWWVTVGANLILIALEFASLLGVVFMYICHVWMDYVWLILVAYLSKRGMDIAGLKWYRIMMAFFGALLIYFGLTFLSSAVISIDFSVVDTHF